MIRCLLFSLLFLLTSCHVGEEYKIDSDFTDREICDFLNITPSNKEIPKDWYTLLNDSDLNTLINTALNNNFTINQWKEKLKQSRYQLAIYSVQDLPTVDLTSNYTYNKTNHLSNYASNANDFRVGFDTSWELDIWGKNQYISDQYFQLFKNTQYSLSNITVSVIAEIISNYIKLRSAQEKLSIAQHNLILQKEILNTVLNKHKSGLADDLTKNQAEQLLENTQATIPTIHQQIENYKNALYVLSGNFSSTLLDLDKPKKNITSKPFKYSVKNLYTLPLDIIRQRPDVKASETVLLQKYALLNESIANLYPSLDLSASFGYISNSSHSLFNTEHQIYGYTASFVSPIWHWKQLVNDVELKRHIKEEALLAYNEAIITAVIELKNSVILLEQEYKVNHYRNSSLLKMKTILTLMQNKYQNGLIDFTDVATAEQNLLSSQMSVIDSNAQILIYILGFYKATGGGYAN